METRLSGRRYRGEATEGSRRWSKKRCLRGKNGPRRFRRFRRTPARLPRIPGPGATLKTCVINVQRRQDWWELQGKKEQRGSRIPKNLSFGRWLLGRENILYSVAGWPGQCINNEKLQLARGRDKSPPTATTEIVTPVEFGLTDSSTTLVNEPRLSTEP